MVSETAEKAATVADKELRDYELVVIFKPELKDETLNAAIENVSKAITGQGGVVSSVEPWGKRKLAYSIKHFMEGNYVLTKLKLKPASTQELETSLRISEEVVRHLLVRLSQ